MNAQATHKGKRKKFDYQRNVKSFFSSQEMELYYNSMIDKKGDSLRMVIHNVLKEYMNEKK